MHRNPHPSEGRRRRWIYRSAALLGVVVVAGGIGYALYVRSKSDDGTIDAEEPQLRELGLADAVRPKAPRRPSLTAERVQKTLDQNDGARDSTHYKGENSETFWDYKVEDGVLRIRASGDTSWSDSHWADEREANVQQARSFIRRNEHNLNMEDIYS